MSSIFDFHITTPRLYISYFDPSSDLHCDSTVELLHGAASMKFMPSSKDKVPDREGARQFLATSRERQQRTGWGRHLVSLRPESEEEGDAAKTFSERTLVPIGTVSMQMARIDGVPGPTIPDVGFNILERYHGKGYATEAVQGLMKYFSDVKGVKLFAGFTNEENESARKLFRRLGFQSHGIRSIGGIMWSGAVEDLDTWTWGLEEGQKLEDFGL